MELWYVELIIEACECQMEQMGRFGYWRSQFLVPLRTTLRYGFVLRALVVSSRFALKRPSLRRVRIFSINFHLQNFGIVHHTEQEV